MHVTKVEPMRQFLRLKPGGKLPAVRLRPGEGWPLVPKPVH